MQQPPPLPKYYVVDNKKFGSPSQSSRPKVVRHIPNNGQQQKQQEQFHNNNGALIRHISLEELNPVHDSIHRKSSPLAAIFNLVATVCGGGVLSLPLAYRRAGIIPTTLLMIYAAFITDFSLYILVSCARRTGGRSYGDVAKSAFGNIAEILTSMTLVVMLCGTLIAYMILVRDVWTPVVFTVSPSLESLIRSCSTGTDREAANIVLCGILFVSLPLLLQKDLHSLRHTCYVGFLSCILLMVAVLYRAYEKVTEEFQTFSSSEAISLSSASFLLSSTSTSTNEHIIATDEHTTPWNTTTTTTTTTTTITTNDLLPPLSSLRWYSTDPADILFAFPITVLCFFCSYNVLGVHASLVNPTRERMKAVLETSLGICFFIFFMVGIGGYLYARNDTVDNILLNFPLSDKVMLLGRVGYCITLLFILPLIMLPCRDALLSIPGQIHDWKLDRALTKEYQDIPKHRKEGAHLIINGVDFDEDTPMLKYDENSEKCHGVILKHNYGSAEAAEHDVIAYNDGGGGFNPSDRPISFTHTYLDTGSGEDQEEDCKIEDKQRDNTDNDKEERVELRMGPACPTTIASSNTENKKEEEKDDKNHHDNNNSQEAAAVGFAIIFLATMVLLSVCFTVAIIVPGVALVWSIFGSSMAILVAFIIPASCYLKIRERKKCNIRALLAWLLLITSIIAAVVCTANTVISAIS